MTLTLVAAAEAAPLWNPLSITTLVLAIVGTVGTLVLGMVAAITGYRRDHPVVRWRTVWAGPNRDAETGDEIVTVWIANRGAGIARDLRISTGADGVFRSGDGWEQVGFGEGLRYAYWRRNDSWSGPRAGDRGRPFKLTIDFELEWSQAPRLHRTHKKRIRKRIPVGAKPEVPRSYILAGWPLNERRPETRDP